MHLLDIVTPDFVNYKKPSMTLMFPYCSFKCNIEYGETICQNFQLAREQYRSIPVSDVIDMYTKDVVTQAVVMQGLEPFDSFSEVWDFVRHFRNVYQDDIVIYTGYKVLEVTNYIEELSKFDNVFVKFGRFIPGQKPHHDEVLGVDLASDNQYAIDISNL